MLLYVLSKAQEHVAKIVDRIVMLSPVTWMDLPDVTMDHVENVVGQEFVGGDGWALQLGGICSKDSTEILCNHPLM